LDHITPKIFIPSILFPNPRKYNAVSKFLWLDHHIQDIHSFNPFYFPIIIQPDFSSSRILKSLYQMYVLIIGNVP